MNLIIALIFFLALPAQALAVEYFVSSGEGAGAVTAGSDSNTCTSVSAPCLTISGALAKMVLAFGYNGVGHFLTLRAGDYNTGAGLKSGSNTLILSGASWASPFTIRAYNASSPGTGCTQPTPVPGGSVCENVTLIRDMNPGPKTLTQMQSIGGPGCGTVACVGAPTLAECQAYGLASSYPGTCWGGSPSHVSPPDQLWLFQDRSNQVLLEAVIEMYGLSESTANTVKYVVWDGVSCDARGVVASCFRDSQHNNHELMASFFHWKNGTWKNSVVSMMSQPGVANGTDPDGIPYEFFLSPRPPAGGPYSRGPRITNDMIWENFKITYSGIPFDTLRSDGTANSGGLELARNTEGAKFLHAFYFHAGGNTCINCEGSFSAGFVFTPESPNNAVQNSYFHDNNGGVQMAGLNWTLENTVFYNNGNTDVQMLGINDAVYLADTNRQRIRNNTFVHGTRGVFNLAIQLSPGSYGAIIENSIIENYGRGIEGQPCGQQGTGSTAYCVYTDRNLIRNNLIRATTPINVPGTDSTGSNNPNSNPVVLPACGPGGSLTLSSCNTYGQDPLFTVGIAPNYAMQTGSPAKDAGFNNGLTRDFLGNVRPVGAGIDVGAYEYCTGGGCTAAPTTAILTVQSNGGSVSVAYTGTSCTPATPVVTTGSITCNLGTAVVLTAPLSATSGNFGFWSGCTSTDTQARTCNVTLNGGTTVVANYGSTKTLTVTTSNPNSGVFIGISPNDLAGQGGCTPSPGTPCIRTFNNGQAVSIDAPDYVGTSFFDSWQGCPNPRPQPNFSECLATMGADRTVTAVFGGNGCHIKKNITAAPWQSPIGLAVTMCDSGVGVFTNPTVSGTSVGTQNTGVTGTIVTDGTYTQPYTYDSDSDYVKVDFASGVDGWISTYSIVSIAPLDTTITANPANPTTSTTGTFSFSGSGGTAPYTFECSLDSAAFSACSIPKSHMSLAFGSHTFQVRSIDSVTATDPTPASFTWDVVATLPPSVAITGNPANPASTQSATFTFTASNCSASGCVFQCHLDGATYSACASGVSYSALAAGTHTFYVKAIDNGTALQSTEAAYPWTITLSGSGTMSVGACVQIIAPGSPVALNITDTWIMPGNFIGTQPTGATGIITATNATTNAQGRTGIRVNWNTPLVLSGMPKNSDVDQASDPDGWISANTANVTVITCTPSAPGAPPSYTTKLGGATIKLGPGTVK